MSDLGPSHVLLDSLELAGTFNSPYSPVYVLSQSLPGHAFQWSTGQYDVKLFQAIACSVVP